MEMEHKKRALLYEWLDPKKDDEIINSTINQLQRLTTPRDIAYGVVSKLIGKGKIDSGTVISKKFIATLIQLAPSLERGDNVAAMRKQINLMKKVMDWDHVENQMKKAQREGKQGDEIILLIRNPKTGEFEKLKNILAENDFTSWEVFTSHFDGESDSTVPELKITGCANDIAEALAAIKESVHGDMGRVFKYISPKNKFERDNITLAQALAIAKSEAQ